MFEFLKATARLASEGVRLMGSGIEELSVLADDLERGTRKFNLETQIERFEKQILNKSDLSHREKAQIYRKIAKCHQEWLDAHGEADQHHSEQLNESIKKADKHEELRFTISERVSSEHNPAREVYRYRDGQLFGRSEGVDQNNQVQWWVDFNENSEAIQLVGMYPGGAEKFNVIQDPATGKHRSVGFYMDGSVAWRAERDSRQDPMKLRIYHQSGAHLFSFKYSRDGNRKSSVLGLYLRALCSPTIIKLALKKQLSPDVYLQLFDEARDLLERSKAKFSY